MIKEESYQKKFELLAPWILKIITTIKKELKNDHLRKEYQFVQKHFSKKMIDKLTIEEMSEAYLKELEEGNEQIGEWISSRWMLKNAEVYHYFATALTEINPKFDEIALIPDDLGNRLMRKGIEQFGAVEVYIFSVLNSVSFSEKIYEELRMLALNEKETNQESVDSHAVETTEELKKQHERNVLKIIDKYEKKLLGMQKKYAVDVEGLKKQIAQLQRKKVPSN